MTFEECDEFSPRSDTVGLTLKAQPYKASALH